MIQLRSLLFSVGMVLSIIVMASLGLLVAPLPPGPRFKMITLWNAFIVWWLKITCGISYVLEGAENIPDTACIILSKHQSSWETIAFAVIFPPQSWLLKRELLWVPFFGWGLALTQPIAIDRSSGPKAVRQLIEIGSKRLNSGRWVVIFPEGTRMAPGSQGRYRMGGPKLAEASGFPVLPVAHNAGEFWPRRSFVKRPGVVRVCVGPLIESRGRNAEQIRALSELWIEAKMQEITMLKAN